MSDFEDFANKIRAWDGEDCNDLQKILRDVLTTQLGMSDDEKGSTEFIAGIPEEVSCALDDVATRDDAPWPSPWDTEAGHDFAEVCDRRGQYISTEWRKCSEPYNHNFVCRWVEA